jgi:hypothetical protein
MVIRVGLKIQNRSLKKIKEPCSGTQSRLSIFLTKLNNWPWKQQFSSPVRSCKPPVHLGFWNNQDQWSFYYDNFFFKQSESTADLNRELKKRSYALASWKFWLHTSWILTSLVIIILQIQYVNEHIYVIDDFIHNPILSIQSWAVYKPTTSKFLKRHLIIYWRAF